MLYSRAESRNAARVNEDLLYRTQSGVIETHANTYQHSFIYDTRFDSDKGSWVLRCHASSWYKTAGIIPNRSEKREFPSISMLLVNNGSLKIKDLTDPELAQNWFVMEHAEVDAFGNPSGALLYNNNIKKVQALNGFIFILCSNAIYIIDLILDVVTLINTTGTYYRDGPGIGYANDSYWENTKEMGDSATYRLPSSSMVSMNVAVVSTSRTDPRRGLPTPTLVAMSSNGKLCVINSDVQNDGWEISNWSDAS
jgi:hypothetical protein